MEEKRLRVHAGKTKIMICRPGPPAEFKRVSMQCLSHWSGQQQHLLQRLQALGAQEMQWAQAFDKGPWLQMYMVQRNCKPFGRQTPEGSPSQTWQTGGGSFLLLPRRHALSSRWLWTFNHNTCENRHEEGAATSSLFPPPLFQHVAACIAVLCGVQCSMPVRLGHWQSQTSDVCSKMTRQWSDRSAMSSHKTLSSPDPMSYFHGLALRTWTSFWRREGSRLLTLMTDIPGDLVWDLPCVQQANYLQGGSLMWMLPCTCTLIKNLMTMNMMT